MGFFSPYPSYAVGTFCVGLGLHCFFRPMSEIPRYGIQLRSSGDKDKDARDGTAWPLVYVKGMREVTYGLALIALEQQGNDDALTTMIALTGLNGLGDAVVMWLHGREEGRAGKLFGHGVTFILFGWWAWWRASFA